MLSAGDDMGWNSPQWRSVYSPRIAPSFRSMPGTGPTAPTSDPPFAHEEPNYLDIIAAEAMNNPQMDALRLEPTIGLFNSDFNEATLS